MIEYTWLIEQCEYDIETGAITVAHYRCNAVDGDFTESAYGTAAFTPDATSPGFKPYDEVTEAEVLCWVWASVGKAQKEANLAAQIQAQKDPPRGLGTPWD